MVIMNIEKFVSHEYLEVNGIRLHVAVAGEGKPIILLHGFPEFWYSWRKVIPKLAEKYRVIVPDMRGYGQSDIPQKGYDIDTLTDDVTALIEYFGDQAVIVSHDWGGVIGWHTATTRPDHVSALVAVAGPHAVRHMQVIMTSPVQFFMSQYMFFFQIPYLPERMLSFNRGWLVSRIMRQSIFRPRAFTEEEMAVYRTAWSNRDSMRAGLDYYRQLFRKMPGLIKRYNSTRIKCPVCVVCGEKDRFITQASARKLDKYCESPPEVHMLKGCGHWIAQEAPDELLEITTRFLDRWY